MKIGLIGAGRIGVVHAAALAQHDKLELTAVYDVDAAAAARCALQHGAAVAESAEAMVGDAAIDGVLIASATATHCDMIESAARAGKRILCEKPLHMSIDRVRQCKSTLDKIGVAAVQLGFNRRFDPGHAALIARVRAGEVGKVEKVIISSRDPDFPSVDYLRASGGLFHDMMIHDFDMARAVLAAEPTRVFAVGAALAAPDICAQAGDVDTAMAVLQTAGGALCHINCSRRAVYGYDQRIEAFGGGGMLISGNRAATAVESFTASATAAREPLLNFFLERYAESYHHQLSAFAGDAAAPTFADGAQALIIANAARESAQRGAWVDIEKF